MSSGDKKELYSYDEGIDKIDWKTMESDNDLFDKEKQEYRKRVRMAECLSIKPIPIEDIQEIAVKNIEAKEIVESKLKNIKVNIFVNIRERWF